MATGYRRGQVLAATLYEDLGEKYYLVVSNNKRNRNLDSVLAVRITSHVKSVHPTMISIPETENNMHGWVLCDEIQEVFPDDVRVVHCAFSGSFMNQIREGLKEALALA